MPAFLALWRGKLTAGILSLAVAATPLPAAALILSLDQPNRASSPGAIEIYSGTITNEALSDLTARDIFFNFSGFDPDVLSFDQLLGLTDFAIPAGATTPDVTLFDVDIGAATALGSPYLADVQVQDIAGDLSNIETISISVPGPGPTIPEPRSLLLLLTAVTFLLVAKHRQSPTYPNGLLRVFNPTLRRALRILRFGSLLLAILAGFGVSSASAQTTPVQLGTSEIGSSVWEDGTISVAVPIVNSGTEIASNVLVQSISLNGTLRGTQLLSLGEILPDGSAVLRTSFSGPAPNVSYLLTISGTYEVSGARFGFSVNRRFLPLESPGEEAMPLDTTNVEVHFPGGEPLPPSPIMPEDEGINPPSPPVPEGPLQMLVPVPPEDTSAALQGSAPPEGSAPVEFTRDTGGYPYPAKAGCPTVAGRRRTRAAPAGMTPAVSWS